MPATRQPKVPKPVPDIEPDVPSQPFLEEQLYGRTTKAGKTAKAAKAAKAPAAADTSSQAYVDAAVEDASASIKPAAPMPYKRLPDEIQQSVEALRPEQRSIHGSKYSLAYFPGSRLRRPCGDRFGYLTSPDTRRDPAAVHRGQPGPADRPRHRHGRAGSRRTAARLDRSTPA